MNNYQDHEPPDGDKSWTHLQLGQLDPTTGGMSYEQRACLWDFRPDKPYRCTRERHTDGWHVATEDGVIVAYAHESRRTP